MVKETNFGKQPVKIEKGLFLGTQQKDLAGIYLELLTAVLTSATNQDDTGWDAMDIAALAVVAGTTMPTNAIAVMLDVAVNDAASAANATMMGFATPGIIRDSKTSYVYPGDVNDRVGSRIVIVELSTDGKVAYKIEASGAAFDYSIKLLGWLIAGTRVSRVSLPYVDLKAKFTVNQ